MKKFFIIVLILFISAFFLVISAGMALWYLWSSNLPYIGSLKDYNPPIITEVFSEDGIVISSFFDEKRILVSLDNVSENLIHAFIAAEDARFFQHGGIDFSGILRALIKNIMAGKIEQGGSTITQQVTKSLLLKNPERTYKRKAREALLSLQIERALSKEKILYLYLNQIYLGHGLYGVGAASQVYFGKEVKDLSIAESALLAGLAKAPSRDDPVNHLDRAKKRQRYVLERMREERFITNEEFEAALNEELDLEPYKKEDPLKDVPYFTEYIRQKVVNQYGRNLVYRGGLKIYTTIDLGMQSTAKAAIKEGIEQLDRREGYRGPLRRVSPSNEQDYYEQAIQGVEKNPLKIGVITEGIVNKIDTATKETFVSIGGRQGVIPFSEMEWARKVDPEKAYYEDKLKDPADVLAPGDVIHVKVIGLNDDLPGWTVSLYQEPEVQAALVCLDGKTGYVKAMVGGSDFYKSQFNRAIQARRQPGSAFKPIIYSAALDKGMTPSSIVFDSAFISSTDSEEEAWKPRNYEETFYGPTLFRTGLIKSRNIVTIKILKKIGTRYAIDYARRFGIESALSPDLSLALGSSGMSLLEITTAYSVFPNGGMLVKPIFIKKIIDRNGEIIEENIPVHSESISEDTAYIMVDLLSAVVSEGTGWRVKELGRPAAGKTGTTNDLKDAWFLGFTPSLVTGVWVGYDDRRPMGKGETGSRAASPIWLSFMKETLKGSPSTPFKQPDGVVIAKIDRETGLLASSYSEKTCFQAFKKGTEPVSYSPKPNYGKPGQFFEMDMEYSK
ncbi:MAG: PBP1A family penicillin-binding protein [Deltaproteobacteria bacterium]|nr:PBP1A family penicillin-binding protein [Deltaproteobacteria bacterium]